MRSTLRSPIVKRIVPIAALATTAFSLAAVGLGVMGPATVRAQAQAAAPGPFVYGFGSQGLGYYYAAPGAQAAPTAPQLTVPARAPQAGTAPRAQSVGPGSRNWATGNRVPSHRPWLRSRR